jgi:lipopolysaccharide/colanic/teichoic acid biosynthesis glycosyltransferase
MHVYPILVDSRPVYLTSAPDASLLRMPLGTGTMLTHLLSRLARVSDVPPAIWATFEPTEEYERAVRKLWPDLKAVLRPGQLGSCMARYEASDCLLIVDPSCYPTGGLRPEELLRAAGSHPQGAQHLVAVDGTAHGTTERVEHDADGRVRRIQRHYENVTWPFSSGIAASLISTSSCALAGDLTFGSLGELRVALSSHGVPSRDIPLDREALDLHEERSFLALSESFTLAATEKPPYNPLLVGYGHRIHPSAKVIGRVILHEDVELHENATVIGPTVIGAGAQIRQGAVVAQSVAIGGLAVPENTIVRHHVFSGTHRANASSAPAYQEPTGGAVKSEDERPLRAFYLEAKAVIEALVALLALVALSPLLLLLALLIKLESHGPILFGHSREGRGGRVFLCWKFRTMYVGAEARQRELAEKNQMDGPQFKLANDPRITRVGRWLRPTSLDEIPQLINVVMGQMSFVGPRPSPFRENQLCVPWREGRLSLRPGITGLWQVCRHDRAQGDFHQWIHYDLLYVRHLSLWVDLKILFATVITMGGKSHVHVSSILPGLDLQQGT